MSAPATQMPFVLGLTGSIGMGKSTTAALFAERGIPVYDADAEVHRLYDGEGVAAVAAAFPGVVVGGRVDRQLLSQQVIGNDVGMARLESIVHPLLRQRETVFLTRAAEGGAKVCVLDIPLLFETGADSRVDAIVVVSAPEAVQRERILMRPGMTTEKLASLLARQMPDADKRRRADFVVDTSRGFDDVRHQIDDILRAIATMPRRRSS